MESKSILDVPVGAFLAAYKSTGLHPTRRSFGDYTRCGCPLTALAKHLGLPAQYCAVSYLESQGFNESELWHFMSGVDEKDLSPIEPTNSTICSYGEKVWAAVKGL